MEYNYKTYQIGEFNVTRVFEKRSTAGSPQFLFKDWNSEVLKKHEHWLVPGCMDEEHEHLIRSIHTWVIRYKQYTILVDTGIGNNKQRSDIPAFNNLNLPYLERLKAVGVNPEDVDYVFLTHLHADHVGWNTHLVNGKWVPTFPNAKYVFAKDENEYFTNNKNDIYEDSILPIINAGQADIIEPNGSQYLDGLSIYPLPGHCDGQVAIILVSQGQYAVFGGDVMHHPIQVYYPEWNSCFCESSDQSIVSRRWLLEYVAEKHAVFFSGHFPESSAGIITKKGKDFQWRFL